MRDFEEHDTLPRGPVEAGLLWNAGSRLSVIIQTFLIWSKKLPLHGLLEVDGAVFLVRDCLHHGALRQDTWPSSARRTARVL